MGIQGLLPLLKSIMLPIHIKDLQGSCVAIDAYSWLHKGAFSCSTQLCKGLPTSRHIEFCMHRVNLLRHYGVKPILVFDGGLLPMKIDQENKRARVRKENLARAIEHEANGNASAAYECYQKALDISPSIAHELIQVLKKENVSYIVAPYEADAQMTFLAVSKYVDAVITEDSDLIPFGCPRIIFKMDKYGQGVEFQYTRLHQNKELSFIGFSKEMLLEMCILSGCDYLQSVPGMGLKRAHALISRFKTYDKVIKHLKYSTVAVPPLYEESFKKAILTFQHQRVYDPATEAIVHLCDIPGKLGDDLDFLGPLIPPQIAKGIAEGNLDPFTQIPFEVQDAKDGPTVIKTPQFKNFKPESGRKKLDLPVQKNVLTKYFCFASLEAKRNFRAPRILPTNANPVNNFCLSPKDYCSVETACDINCSKESLLDSKTVPSISCNETTTYGFATEPLDPSKSPKPGMMDENDKGSPDCILLHQFGHSSHKPHQGFLKGCDFKGFESAIGDEIRTENERVTEQSSYFLQKSVENIDRDSKQESFLVNDAVASDVCDNALRSSYKTITSNKKIIVRSSYFRHKSEKKNDQDDDNERCSAKDDETLTSGEPIPEVASSDVKYLGSSASKRKASPNVAQRENIKPKNMQEDSNVSSDGCFVPNLDETSMDTSTEEGKFGSDISHLSRYSDIAEKSMERFVSVISSFKYSSRGSRASGLRAPLKNIKNTCENRSTGNTDFTQFSYIPKSSRGGMASRRS